MSLSRLRTDTLCKSRYSKRGEWRLREVPVASLDRHPGNKENQTLRSELDANQVIKNHKTRSKVTQSLNQVFNLRARRKPKESNKT